MITRAETLLPGGDPGRRLRGWTASGSFSVMDWHPDIDIEIVERGGAVVLAVTGELDLCAAPELEQALATVGARKASAIVVDLDRVSFMDSAAVHVLLQFSVSEGYRERLTLSAGSPQVRRLLELTGLKRYLSFADGR